MGKAHLIGVDLGTMGTKAAIFDTAGQLLADAYEESRLHYPRPGWVEQDPDEIYASAVVTVRACLERSGVDPSAVAGIAFDGQMAGIGSVDRDWGTPTHYDSWLDTRCGPYIDRLQAHAQDIIRLSGGPPTISHGAKILWWMHERPDVFRRIARFVVPGGYVAGRMAGLRGDDAYMDRSYLHFTCFSDTQAGRWSEALLGEFGLDSEKLPRVVDPWEVIGKVSREAARDTGLLEGTPIAAGCGDQTAGMLGAAMVEPGMVFDVAGTASVFAVCQDRFRPDQSHRTMFTACLALPDLYYSLAYINGGGLNLRWFRDELAPDLKAEAEARGENFYAAADRMAEAAGPGAGNLLFLPHLGGRVCPSEADARGVFVGLHWSHGRGHLYRAMLEAVGFEYSHYLEIVRGLLPDLRVTETRVIGGGARSRLWNQIKADILGVPYVTLNREEFAVLGSAILAGFAVGVFDDMGRVARQFTLPRDRLTPDPERHAFYRRLARSYSDLLHGMRSSFEDLATHPEPPATSDRVSAGR